MQREIDRDKQLAVFCGSLLPAQLVFLFNSDMAQQCKQLHPAVATQCTPTLHTSKDSLSFCILLLIKVLLMLCDVVL